MTKEELLQLKYVCTEYLEDLIVALNLDVSDRGEYFNGNCPVHSGNNRSAFSIRKEDLTWKCWTKACHQKCGSDIVGLVRGIKGCTFPAAIKHLQDFLVAHKTGNVRNIVEKVDNRQFFKRILKDEPEGEFKEEFFKNLTSHPYPLERGFTRECLNHFNIGYCKDPASEFNGYIIFPVRDSKGRRVGFSCRAVDPNVDKKNRWKNEGKLHKYIFGLAQALPYIDKHKSVVVVEGPFKAMRLWEAGIKNCVAIFGTQLSDEQHSTLLSSGAFTIILATDSDESGEKARERIKTQLLQYFYVKDLIFPWADVDKVNRLELRKWLEGNELCQSILELESPVSEKSDQLLKIS